MGNHRVALGEEVAASQHPGAVHRHRLDDDHRRAAAGALAVIAEMAVPGQALVAHVDGVGAEHHPVRQRAVPELDRREDIGEFSAHDGSPCASAGIRGAGEGIQRDCFQPGYLICIRPGHVAADESDDQAKVRPFSLSDGPRRGRKQTWRGGVAKVRLWHKAAFDRWAASGSLGSKLPFAALSTNGSNADFSAIRHRAFDWRERPFPAVRPCHRSRRRNEPKRSSVQGATSPPAMGFILQKPGLLVNSLYPNCPAQGAHSTDQQR